MFKKIILLTLVLIIISSLGAQLLEHKLEAFSKQNAKGYLQPLANSMGANLNSGLFTTAKILGPFKPSVSIGSAIVSISSSEKSFQATPPNTKFTGAIDPLTDNNIYDTKKVKTATVFGKKGGKFITTPEAADFYNDLSLPDGANLSLLPLPFATVSLGLPFDNEIMIKGLPPTSIDQKIGKIYFIGGGVKHGLTQWIPGLKVTPIDLAIQGIYQDMDIAKIITIRSYGANFIGSINIPLLGFYSGIGYEHTSLEARYKYNQLQPETTIKISQKVKLEADNDWKFTIGAKYKPFPLTNIHFDYTFANTASMNLGIGIGF